MNAAQEEVCTPAAVLQLGKIMATLEFSKRHGRHASWDYGRSDEEGCSWFRLTNEEHLRGVAWVEKEAGLA